MKTHVNDTLYHILSDSQDFLNSYVFFQKPCQVEATSSTIGNTGVNNKDVFKEWFDLEEYLVAHNIALRQSSSAYCHNTLDVVHNSQQFCSYGAVLAIYHASFCLYSRASVRMAPRISSQGCPLDCQNA